MKTVLTLTQRARTQSPTLRANHSSKQAG